MKGYSFTLLIASILVFQSCSTDREGIANKKQEFVPTKMECLFFFIPDCPACRSCFVPLLELKKKYGDYGLEIRSIMSDPYPDDSLLTSTIEYYEYDLPIEKDTTLQLAATYGVTTTPQILLLDSARNVVYNGLLNNEYYSFGKHRVKISEHYLEDAILSLLAQEEIIVKRTEPIGCKINFDTDN